MSLSMEDRSLQGDQYFRSVRLWRKAYFKN
jgi:hypothetical protein